MVYLYLHFGVILHTLWPAILCTENTSNIFIFVNYSQQNDSSSAWSGRRRETSK